MIRKIMAATLLLASGVCGYQGVSPYINACSEQIRLEKIAYSGTDGMIMPEDPYKSSEIDEQISYVSPIDFTALRSVNPDIIGWIRIPGTMIDYPICWRAGDNEYYMAHSAEGEAKRYGAIMMDGSNLAKAREQLLVLYGHHMRNGTMFHDIVKYTQPDFLDAHMEILLFFPDRKEKYRVIGTFTGPAEKFEPSQMIDNEFLFETWYQSTIGEMTGQPLPDKILALVTCSYASKNERTICFAAAED